MPRPRLCQLLTTAVGDRDLRKLESIAFLMKTYRELMGLADEAGVDRDELEELLQEI